MAKADLFTPIGVCYDWTPQQSRQTCEGATKRGRENERERKKDDNSLEINHPLIEGAGMLEVVWWSEAGVVGGWYGRVGMLVKGLAWWGELAWWGGADMVEGRDWYSGGRG